MATGRSRQRSPSVTGCPVQSGSWISAMRSAAFTTPECTDARYWGSMAELLWEPSEERVQRATLTRYTDWLKRERGLSFADYQELWAWSVDDLDGFWSSIVQYFEVRFETGGEQVLGSREMPGAQWCAGAEI